MIGRLGRQGPAATLGQHCPQMTRIPGMHNYFLLDARGEREFDFEPDEFAKSPAVAVKRKRRLWALGRHFLQRRTESVALAKHDDSDRSLLKCDMFS